MKTMTTLIALALTLNIWATGIKPVEITQAHKDRAAELISRMTLQQKCALISGQLGQKEDDPNAPDGWVPNRNTLAGCPELGVQPIYMADGPQGINHKIIRKYPCTYYACGISAAASFDREAVLAMGDGLGMDARARGVGFLLGPGANIYRTALCGRNFEYFGEDPYLAGEMAKQYILGVQSHGVIATIKHFAANNQEWDRFICSSSIDERTMNEIYFPAFRKAVEEAKVGAIMTACGKLNGLQCSENPYLLRQTLREDWNFEGCTMCDWQTIYSTLNGIRGGLDIEMPNPFTHNYERVQRLVDNGVVREAEIDEKCQHVLQTLIAFGLLDRPLTDEALPLDNPYCHQKAYEAAIGGPVMVKNNGILPLAKSRRSRILIAGPYADAICAGGGSGGVTPFKGRYVTTVKGMQNLGSGYESDHVEDPSEEQVRNARAVIVEVGHGRKVEKENIDHPFALPEAQEKLLQKISGLTDKMIVIVHSGCEVDMRAWGDKAAAIIYAWYGGEHTGTVLADLISGKVSPSGRLPFTMWGSFENNPCSETYYADRFQQYHGRTRFDENPHVDYKEGVFMGYRGIEKFNRKPLYPFGYGLTYSEFSYSDLKVTPAGEGFDVSFSIANIGKSDAAEVAQVYVAPIDPSLPRPVRELKEFAKIKLKKGEKKVVNIHLPHSAFEHYDVVSHGWVADEGEYKIQIGINAQKIILEDTVKL